MDDDRPLHEFTELNEYRLARRWHWQAVATAMERAGLALSTQTLLRLQKRPPRDRTLHKIQEFLRRVRAGLIEDPAAPASAPAAAPSADPVTHPYFGRSAFRVGQPLPKALTAIELGAILGIGAATARRLEKTGAFRDFLLRQPQVGPRPLYSGSKVQRWLDAEPVSASKYFKSRSNQ